MEEQIIESLKTDLARVVARNESPRELLIELKEAVGERLDLVYCRLGTVEERIESFSTLARIERDLGENLEIAVKFATAEDIHDRVQDALEV